MKKVSNEQKMRNFYLLFTISGNISKRYTWKKTESKGKSKWQEAIEKKEIHKHPGNSRWSLNDGEKY